MKAFKFMSFEYKTYCGKNTLVRIKDFIIWDG